MRIKIDFADARNYVNMQDKFLNDCGEDLKQVIIEDYFNGAELAVNYLGYYLIEEYFEFELMPN